MVLAGGTAEDGRCPPVCVGSGPYCAPPTHEEVLTTGPVAVPIQFRVFF